MSAMSRIVTQFWNVCTCWNNRNTQKKQFARPYNACWMVMSLAEALFTKTKTGIRAWKLLSSFMRPWRKTLPRSMQCSSQLSCFWQCQLFWFLIKSCFQLLGNVTWKRELTSFRLYWAAPLGLQEPIVRIFLSTFKHTSLHSGKV